VTGAPEPAEAVRLDKWLWRARFFRTRSLAARAAAAGVRINGQRTDKPGAAVRPGDVLTFVQAGRVRVIEVLGSGERRGPAPEACALYLDREGSRPSDT
jgi:ribosome-associated heat shock protein Hsp15